MLTWLGYIDGIHGTPYIAAPLGSVMGYIQNNAGGRIRPRPRWWIRRNLHTEKPSHCGETKTPQVYAITSYNVRPPQLQLRQCYVCLRFTSSSIKYDLKFYPQKNIQKSWSISFLSSKPGVKIPPIPPYRTHHLWVPKTNQPNTEKNATWGETAAEARGCSLRWCWA
jgi:hypothetical protein